MNEINVDELIDKYVVVENEKNRTSSSATALHILSQPTEHINELELREYLERITIFTAEQHELHKRLIWQYQVTCEDGFEDNAQTRINQAHLQFNKDAAKFITTIKESDKNKDIITKFEEHEKPETEELYRLKRKRNLILKQRETIDARLEEAKSQLKKFETWCGNFIGGLTEQRFANPTEDMNRIQDFLDNSVTTEANFKINLDTFASLKTEIDSLDIESNQTMIELKNDLHNCNNDSKNMSYKSYAKTWANLDKELQTQKNSDEVKVIELSSSQEEQAVIDQGKFDYQTKLSFIETTIQKIKVLFPKDFPLGPENLADNTPEIILTAP